VIDKLKAFIQNKKLLAPTDRVLLAVSGGLDSMVMLHLFQSLNYPLAIAHANFQLRGEISDYDEAFVESQAEKLKIPFFCQRFETNNYAMQMGWSVQMAARHLRYQWFEKLTGESGFNKIATAHHFNDSIETFLLSWLRGGGIESLRGIFPKRDGFIRPLLCATRDELVDYAAKNQVIWREDASNIEDHYHRNHIRHRVIPQVKIVNDSLEQTLQVSHRRVEGELEFFQESFFQWKEKNVIISGDQIKIAKSSLREPYSASLLYHCLRDVGFNFEQCEGIIQSLDHQPGKQFLSETHHVVVDRAFILLAPVATRLEEVMIGAGQLYATNGEWKMEIHIQTDWRIPKDNQQALLDASRIAFPLRWRKWRPGDTFYPLGMNHPKKVSDFLIDQKISRPDKEGVTVLESGGEIVWVVGHRIDNRFKITPHTKQALSFHLHL
jgi:tRNA(Ile)-lysidine synthase